MSRTVLFAVGAVLTACAAALPACGTATNPPLVPQPSAQAGNDDIEIIGPAGSPLRLTTARSSRLGTIITDGNTITLYRFDGDSAKPSRSRCVGACARDWRPVLVADPDELRVDGIDRDIVDVMTRPDGTVQVTVAGWPVYRFVGDRGPGQVRGHGRDGDWFALTPSGSKATGNRPKPT
jgi:predicted lipoprotein with Yx(FWY)xxD motif